ncbi:MAG: hypothetical protein J5838_02965, partial [Desulfovibrio sp.]|nr:hypothetical protein [Desulfovibrio sp.]
MADVILARPQAGSTQTVPAEAQARYVMQFPAAAATMERPEGSDNLIFRFDDGSVIELQDFYKQHNTEDMPEFEVDGQLIAGADFFESFGPDLAPAAGLAAPSGGAHFMEEASTDLMGGFGHLGGVDPGTVAVGDGAPADNGLSEGMLFTPSPYASQDAYSGPANDGTPVSRVADVTYEVSTVAGFEGFKTPIDFTLAKKSMTQTMDVVDKGAWEGKIDISACHVSKDGAISYDLSEDEVLKPIYEKETRNGLTITNPASVARHANEMCYDTDKGFGQGVVFDLNGHSADGVDIVLGGFSADTSWDKAKDGTPCPETATLIFMRDGTELGRVTVQSNAVSVSDNAQPVKISVNPDGSITVTPLDATGTKEVAVPTTVT